MAPISWQVRVGQEEVQARQEEVQHEEVQAGQEQVQVQAELGQIQDILEQVEPQNDKGPIPAGLSAAAVASAAGMIAVAGPFGPAVSWYRDVK